MDCVKRKRAFEHAQNERIHIILRMRIVSSVPLQNIDTFYGSRWFWQRTMKAVIRLRGRAVWSGPSLSAYAQRHVLANIVKLVRDIKAKCEIIAREF